MEVDHTNHVGSEFDVLDRNLDIKRNYLLEASAGTGKTFSIENIVVRLLLETAYGPEPITIDQLLVVTFTRAAARELKRRIYDKLHSALEGFLGNGHLNDPPDYLLAFLEKEETERWVAKNALQQALATFDDATICTIHSFCARTLSDQGFEGEIHAQLQGVDQRETDQLCQRVIKDFFRVGLSEQSYSCAQLKLLLKHYQGGPEQLSKALAITVKRGLTISEEQSYIGQLDLLKRILLKIQESWVLDPGKVMEDFENLSKGFTKTCDRSGNLLPKIREQAEWCARFFAKEKISASDFDYLIQNGWIFTSALDPSRRKKRAVEPPVLHYPGLFEELHKQLYPLIEKARSHLSIFAKMASTCQKLYQRTVAEEEIFGPEELLYAMKRACKYDSFVFRVRNQFRATIIDEFQDTDPVQWEIFEKIFLDFKDPWQGYLYLVGDPKQSIYAFRNADVYTYLAAKKRLGADHQATLDTNYRSSRPLVEALNALFSTTVCGNLIALPRQGISLEVQPVRASPYAEQNFFSDGIGSVHFVATSGDRGRSRSWPTVEVEQTFFPYILEQVQNLKNDHGLRYSDCAVLVRNRFQADRLIQFFEEHDLPAVARRNLSLADSLATSALREILQMVVQPRKKDRLYTALGGVFIGWNNEQVKHLQKDVDENPIIEKVQYQLWQLHHTLFSEGFCAFFQQLLTSCWDFEGQNCTLEKQILLSFDNSDLHTDLHHLAEILTEFQISSHAAPEELIALCQQIEAGEYTDQQKILVRRDPGVDGINILTLHLSKGLEYKAVFALGLINRTPQKEELVQIEKEGVLQLAAVDSKSEYYLQHCEEVDAEKMRQLYVAMTRAKYRLYNFVVDEEKPKPVPFGTASPMELFLARLARMEQDHSGDDYRKLYERIGEKYGLREAIRKFAEETSTEITYEEIINDRCIEKRKSKGPCSSKVIDEDLKLVFPKKIDVPGAPVWITSFSGLAKEHESGGLHVWEEVPHDLNVENRSIHTLPAGAEVGTVLHNVLEKIPFLPNWKEKIDQVLLETSVYPGWEEVIKQMVINLWTTPLLGGEDSFCLADVDGSKVFREMEFIFKNANSLYVEEEKSQTQFLKGFIDLVFEHKGKIYLLDWKSNWLGPGNESYTVDKIKRAMYQHDYFLQANIYTEALRKYLELYHVKPFEEWYGGTFYLFVRGVQPNLGPKCGVYHILNEKLKIRNFIL